MAIIKRASTGIDGATPNIYYIVDLSSEKPMTGLSVGDNCFCKDVNKFYIATGATTWQEIGASSGGSGGGAWVDDGTNVYLVNQTRKVGIGISSPANNLDVSGSLKFKGDLTIAETVASVTATLPASVSGLVGLYTVASFNDATNVWSDTSGSNNNTVAFLGNPNVFAYTVPGNGASIAFSTVKGTTNDGLSFPAAILPTTYTLFHVGRHCGPLRSRIFDGMTNNWLSGFHAAGSGLAYHNNGWLGPAADVHGLNWVLSTDQNNSYRSNGVLRGTISGGANTRLAINQGLFTGSEKSDWEMSEIVVYNRTLTSSEIAGVEKYLSDKYGISLPAAPNGGVLYCESGALKYRGANGTVSTIAAS